MLVFELLSFDNEVFRGLVTWSGILFAKMFLTSFWTSFQRFKNGVRFSIAIYNIDYTAKFRIKIIELTTKSRITNYRKTVKTSKHVWGDIVKYFL
jgi:hypothetical protein